MDASLPDERPIDGSSIFPLLKENKSLETRAPMAFRFEEQVAVIDGDIKLYKADRNTTFKLFDLKSDPMELTDISEQMPANA